MIDLIRFWKRKPTILVFIHLMQDLDMYLPLLSSIKNKNDFAIKVCILDKILEKSPRISKALAELEIKYIQVSRMLILAGLEPNLLGIQAVITASESTANPHKLAHVLTKRANKLGIFTYTLQHGSENIGLNYSDEKYTLEDVKFASHKILIWGDVDSLPSELSLETRKKCVSVGCPKSIKANKGIQLSHHRDHIIAVFENLHWERYNEEYRMLFLQDLEKTAKYFPDTTFLVKPHHAGVWLTHKYQGHLPQSDNIIIADPRSHCWEDFTAPELIATVDGAITTPSTVALDAARFGCPVSVISYGLNLSNYQPLPLINDFIDWIGFVKRLRNSEERLVIKKELQSYVSNNIIVGDAVTRIVDLIANDICTKNYISKN